MPGQGGVAEWCGSPVQDQQQPPFNGLFARNEDMRDRGCKCTRGHAYKSCPRFSEHFWAWFAAWFAEGAANNDFCTCPPTDEALLMLECPKLRQHIQVCPFSLLWWCIELTIFPRASAIEISHCRTLLRSLANVRAQVWENIFQPGVVFTGSTWIAPGRVRHARTRKTP
jgi:hypothetical protein